MSGKKMSFDKSKFKNILKMDIKDIKNLISGNGEVKVAKKKAIKIPKKLVGFDIGTSSIKIVVGKKVKEQLIIEKMITIPTPESGLMDGRITNIEELSGIIKFALSEAKIKENIAVCTTKSTLIINREILIPKVEEEEMETVIKYEIQQYLPINLDDYILQFTVLNEIVDDNGIKLKVNVISFPQKIAKDYYNLLLASDLKPFALDVEFNSVDKLMDMNTKINDYEYKNLNAVAFVDIGAASINVTIYKHGKLDFTRIIKSGGDNIDYALSQKLGMSPKLIESVKIEKSNLYNVAETDDTNVAIKEVVDDWIFELERILNFYKNKNSVEDIANIYIYGGTSNIKGLCATIKEKTGIKTRRISSLDNVVIVEKESSESLEQYINAIGSLIRY